MRSLSPVTGVVGSRGGTGGFGEPELADADPLHQSTWQSSESSTWQSSESSLDDSFDAQPSSFGFFLRGESELTSERGMALTKKVDPNVDRVLLWNHTHYDTKHSAMHEGCVRAGPMGVD